MRIDGNINKESDKAFARVFDAEVQRVELNSGDGDVLAALRIASQIREAGLEVVVDGYRLSSCANYLFTSGSKRTLRYGFGQIDGTHDTLLLKAYNQPFHDTPAVLR